MITQFWECRNETCLILVVAYKVSFGGTVDYVRVPFNRIRPAIQV